MTLLPIKNLPNGQYDVVGIINHGPKGDLHEERLGRKVEYAIQSSMVWRQADEEGAESFNQWNTGTSQTETGSAYLIQAGVPNRPALGAYHWHATLEKVDDVCRIHWGQLHTGNKTNDPKRTHAPFYASVPSLGRLSEGWMTEMRTEPKEAQIHYLEHQFGGQRFLDWDITDRFFGRDHMTAYTSELELQERTPSDGPWAGKQLYWLKEHKGFKAPRMLLCGDTQAVMTYILRKKTD